MRYLDSEKFKVRFSFDRFSKSARTFIHKNLSVALILAQLLFMFGVTKTSNKVTSVIFAITDSENHWWLTTTLCVSTEAQSVPVSGYFVIRVLRSKPGRDFPYKEDRNALLEFLKKKP